MSDPAAAELIAYRHVEFERYRASAQSDRKASGIAVYFEPTPAFETQDGRLGASKSPAWGSLLGYLGQHRQLVAS